LFLVEHNSDIANHDVIFHKSHKATDVLSHFYYIAENVIKVICIFTSLRRQPEKCRLYCIYIVFLCSLVNSIRRKRLLLSL